MPKHLARLPRRHHVDDGVPKPLQWEHKGAHILEGEGGLVVVHDRVDPVGT